MENERACANEELRPVTDTENKSVRGRALCGKTVKDNDEKRVAELRQQHEAYIKSLPKTEESALEAIHKITSKDLRDIYEKECAARLAFVIIGELASKIEEDIDLADALKWLAVLGRNAVNLMESDLNRVHDISRQFHPMFEPFRA